jgi:hypothetical protein
VDVVEQFVGAAVELQHRIVVGSRPDESWHGIVALGQMQLQIVGERHAIGIILPSRAAL